MAKDDINIFTGLTLTDISVRSDFAKIRFTDSDNNTYLMWHEQDCCEHVDIEEIIGDINDLLYTPILFSESVSNSDIHGAKFASDDSYTWTFYKLSTIKGSVTIRWYGSSNGCYSESVSFAKVRHEQ